MCPCSRPRRGQVPTGNAWGITIRLTVLVGFEAPADTRQGIPLGLGGGEFVPEEVDVVNSLHYKIVGRPLLRVGSEVGQFVGRHFSTGVVLSHVHPSRPRRA